MFQEFFTDTLFSRYIKTLLQETPVPLFECVFDGDTIVAGEYYIYDRFVIQCEQSGILAVSIEEKENLYPSDTLFPSAALFPATGYRSARFYVRALLDTADPRIFSTYRSVTNHYDPDTHRQLGKYLRYIKATQGLNLLPYYNCYAPYSIPDIELLKTAEEVGVVTVTKQTTKVVAVPILFGKSYKIAIDCNTPVLMRAIFYGSQYMEKASTALSNTSVALAHMSFKSPQRFSVEISDANKIPTETGYSETSLYALQKYLWLIIQLPVDNDSSIVVLEDYDTVDGVFTDQDTVRQYSVYPSLFYMNTRRSFAFSDRLVEYLLGNVIHMNDPHNKNILKIQEALSSIPPVSRNAYDKRLKLKRSIPSVWDDAISQTVLRLVEETKDTYLMLDQDGNINKDVEQLILKKGVNY